jgi:CBS domain-containing protein
MPADFTAATLSQHDVVTVEPTTLLSDAARLMRQEHVGCLVVVRREAPQAPVPVGMLTDRDIVVSAVAGELDIRSLRVADVIDDRLVSVRQTDPLPDVLALMRCEGVRRVPVVGAHHHLVGILSLDDVLQALAISLQQVVETMLAALRSESMRRP